MHFPVIKEYWRKNCSSLPYVRLWDQNKCLLWIAFTMGTNELYGGQIQLQYMNCMKIYCYWIDWMEASLLSSFNTIIHEL